MSTLFETRNLNLKRNVKSNNIRMYKSEGTKFEKSPAIVQQWINFWWENIQYFGIQINWSHLKKKKKTNQWRDERFFFIRSEKKTILFVFYFFKSWRKNLKTYFKVFVSIFFFTFVLFCCTTKMWKIKYFFKNTRNINRNVWNNKKSEIILTN